MGSRSPPKPYGISKTCPIFFRLKESNTCTASPSFWYSLLGYEILSSIRTTATTLKKKKKMNEYLINIMSYLWRKCNELPPGGWGMDKRLRNNNLNLLPHGSHSDRWGQLCICPWVVFSGISTFNFIYSPMICFHAFIEKIFIEGLICVGHPVKY